MTLAAALVVNWSTPRDVTNLIASYETHETLRVPWVLHQNRHPQVNPYTLIEQVRHVTDSPVELTFSDNLGHGYGINRAAEHAAKTWEPLFYFILNPDCLFTYPIMATLIDYLGQQPTRLIVGPKQLDSQSRITAGGIIGTHTKPQHRYWRTPDPANTLARDIIETCPTVAGSAMMVKANPFHKLGGLLEAKHYYSETWLAYHGSAHGYTSSYHGATWMIHEWHQSTPVGSPLSDGTMQEDRELFRRMCDEHNPPILRD